MLRRLLVHPLGPHLEVVVEAPVLVEEVRREDPEELQRLRLRPRPRQQARWPLPALAVAAQETCLGGAGAAPEAPMALAVPWVLLQPAPALLLRPPGRRGPRPQPQAFAVRPEVLGPSHPLLA